MKWVVGGVAVLIAFVMGISVGWVARAHQPVEQAPITTAPLPTTPHPRPLPSPIVTTPHAPLPWVEDTEAFAWPKGPASADVVAVDANHYLVRRSYIGTVLEDQTTLMRDARIVPVSEDGGVVGIKIFGVRPTSTLARFGLQNGDTLETINGIPLGSPDNALEAYTRLCGAKKVVLHIERRGAPLDIHYLLDD